LLDLKVHEVIAKPVKSVVGHLVPLLSAFQVPVSSAAEMSSSHLPRSLEPTEERLSGNEFCFSDAD
jgi:hypothetical protein